MNATAPEAFQLQTDWRESMKLFGLMMGSVAALSYGMMKGAVAANYAVSGAPFKVAIGNAKIGSMVAYPDTAEGNDGKRQGVLLAGLNGVEAKNVCLSLSAPTPFGNVGFRLDAASNGKPLTLDNTVADATAVTDGGGTLHNAEIGRDASRFDNGVRGPDGKTIVGPRGRSGIQTGNGQVSNLKASAVKGTAGSLSFNDAKIGVGFTGVKQCY